MNLLQRGLCLLGGALLVASQADAYGVFTLTAGRKDFANRYDKLGQLMYPAQANAVYDFGKWANFNALPPGVTAANVSTAITNAASAWSQYANIKYDTSGFNAAGTGMLRLRYDATMATGAYAYAYAGATPGEVGYAEMVFGKKAAGGVDWNATNFAWTIKHEMGHTLGLTDLYENQTEDFADHSVGSVDNPNLEDDSTKDNVMHRYNNGNDYSKNPTTDIDNDDIFGLSMLWGWNASQIFSGDLGDFNANGRRGSAVHHGQQDGNWWTYRGTFADSYLLVDKPYIDIEFPGFTGDFAGETWGVDNPGFEYVGNQGGVVERFRVKKDKFVGNFRLKLKSKFNKEARLSAWVTTGGNGISFTKAPNLSGLTYEQGFGGVRRFAKIYGPVPEPATWLAMGLGAAVLIRRRRR